MADDKKKKVDTEYGRRKPTLRRENPDELFGGIQVLYGPKPFMPETDDPKIVYTIPDYDASLVCSRCKKSGCIKRGICTNCGQLYNGNSDEKN